MSRSTASATARVPASPGCRPSPLSWEGSVVRPRRASSVPAGQALTHYKGEGAVERRYHDFKGPLAVAPVSVQHNRRVAALVQVICLALLIFCLIERQVRRALGPEQTMSGLYPDNRRVRPTDRMIFYHLGELTLRIGSITDPPTVRITCGAQLHLLDLLDTGIGQNRWPQTCD
ncbi:hypothetical protein ACFY8O_33270 [Streptomyces argenteolus]|uniref:DDE family transposase n=1 Tax=Streptomyces argenteolus TaxID=67274 RepID=A0ABW6XGB6_9ACTN